MRFHLQLPYLVYFINMKEWKHILNWTDAICSEVIRLLADQFIRIGLYDCADVQNPQKDI